MSLWQEEYSREGSWYSSDIVDDIGSELYRQIAEPQRTFVLDTHITPTPKQFSTRENGGWIDIETVNLFTQLHPEFLEYFAACSEVSDGRYGGRISAPHPLIPHWPSTLSTGGEVGL